MIIWQWKHNFFPQILLNFTQWTFNDGLSRCVCYLRAVSRAVALSSGAPCAGVSGPGWLPGPLLGGAVVVEVPAVLVLVGLPVAQRVDGRAGGIRRQAGLGDLQFLEVGVNRRLGAARAWRRYRLIGERKRERGRAVSHLWWFLVCYIIRVKFLNSNWWCRDVINTQLSEC